MRTTVESFDQSSRLPEGKRRWIVDTLVPAMPRHEVAQYFRVKHALLNEAAHLSVASQDGLCAGVAALSGHDLADGRRMAYIETLLVAEAFHQSRTTFRLLSNVFASWSRQESAFPDVVAMRTYNPRTYVLMRKFALEDGATNFYPALSTPNVQHEATATLVAVRVAEGHVFEASSGIVLGGSVGVSNGFWHESPSCGDSKIDTFFYRRMTANDRLLCFVDTSSCRAKYHAMRKLGLPTPIHNQETTV